MDRSVLFSSSKSEISLITSCTGILRKRLTTSNESNFELRGKEISLILFTNSKEFLMLNFTLKFVLINKMLISFLAILCGGALICETTGRIG